ncbi:MAG: head-tail adaptor protein [Pseudomonadota bacterium]
MNAAIEAIDPGALNTPFRHRTPNTTIDAHGAPQATWTDNGVRWGRFEVLAASNVERAEHETAVRSATILLRADPSSPITSGDELVATQVWRVQSVSDADGSGRFIHARCASANAEADR